MTPDQTIAQLRFAADLLETGHPYEFTLDQHQWFKSGNDPLYHIKRGDEIRPIFATPPDNRPLHNPQNLTAEQVGVGYRLLVSGETMIEGCQYWLNGWHDGESIGEKIPDYNRNTTCRLPLSVPWPEAKPDPYAELKKAHAEGKVLEFFNGLEWSELGPNPSWICAPHEYRIKPEPAFQLPPPPPGKEWHRKDWSAGMLPCGTRPLADGEVFVSGDEWFECGKWMPHRIDDVSSVECNHRRTRRPLTFEHAGKTWTWHRPGDPMPCDGKKRVAVLFKDAGSREDMIGEDLCWTTELREDEWIIGWRYADEKTTVPLGPEDVPPGSVITGKDGGWAIVTSVNDDGVGVDARDEPVSFQELMEHGKINRPRNRDADGNPTLWELCHKQA